LNIFITIGLTKSNEENFAKMLSSLFHNLASFQANVDLSFTHRILDLDLELFWRKTVVEELTSSLIEDSYEIIFSRETSHWFVDGKKDSWTERNKN